MFVKFAPRFQHVALPLLALDAGYEKLTREYDTNDWPFYQFVCCYQGRGFCKVEDRSYPLSPGTVLFLKPGVRHRYASDGEACYVSWVSFEGYLMERLCADNGLAAEETVVILQDRSHPELHLEIMSIFEHMDDPFALDRVSGVLYRMVIEFVLQLKLQAGASRNADLVDGAVLNAIEWMKRHLAEPPDITGMAGELSISRQHLCRLFQQKFGVTTKEYFTKLKILQSQKDLIELAEKPVKDIAESLGFMNASHFTRVFRQATGVSPGAFRASYFAKGT